MPVKQLDYEILLSEYSGRDGALAELKKYRPYLELLPSMRRSLESLITIPLPIARIRNKYPDENNIVNSPLKAYQVPCDLAIILCDPEWKIKMEGEILIFIHRPHEDFSNLLTRWRKTQMSLDQEYEWIMPPPDQHMFSEGSRKLYPLFVLFPDTPERIKKGLAGACLPFYIYTPSYPEASLVTEVVSTGE